MRMDCMSLAIFFFKQQFDDSVLYVVASYSMTRLIGNSGGHPGARQQPPPIISDFKGYNTNPLVVDPVPWFS